ncbi:MAG: molybdenum cofactor biosynthesis protein MoaE [Rhodobacteraceae bacterium]|nr:molybdenum cofactor biosynthesis protein MoaE [Paracoccaceae bacterium]
MRVVVQSEPFDLGAEAETFAKGAKGAGAVVSFTGIVRDLADGDLDAMVIEHYPGMTEKSLTRIAEQAIARWALRDALVIHRYGRLVAGDRIMMAATAAQHRQAAFDAAAFLMDYLKSRAPFWKKELRRDGADWVAARTADEHALARW